MVGLTAGVDPSEIAVLASPQARRLPSMARARVISLAYSATPTIYADHSQQDVETAFGIATIPDNGSRPITPLPRFRNGARMDSAFILSTRTKPLHIFIVQPGAILVSP